AVSLAAGEVGAEVEEDRARHVPLQVQLAAARRADQVEAAVRDEHAHGRTSSIGPAPRGATSRRRTAASSPRARIPASQPSASSGLAQTITVGPEPDTVTPAAPAGGSSRSGPNTVERGPR